MEVFQGAAHELGAGLTVGHGCPHVQVEDRAAGVFALQLFLVFEGGEGVWGVGDRQLGGVGVVGFPLGSGVDDVGESFAVFLGEPVGGAFRRGGLQVEQMPGLFLRGDDEAIDVVE